MKSFSQLGSLLYGRPHLITQEALDALHEGYQSHLRGAGGADVAGIVEELGHLAGRFTGFKMDSEGAPPDGRDPSGFLRIGPVAIVSLGGVIGRNLSFLNRLCSGGCDLNRVDAALSGAAAAGDIREIVLLADTPGGSAVGTPETAALFRAIGTQKRTYAFSNGQCCSAGYYIASQAAQVFCSQSAWLGSIGVRSIFLDKTMQLATEGVKVNAISSGKWKNAGASWKEMTPEERAMFAAFSDQIYRDFCAAVSAARPQIAADSMEGQCFIGAKAVEAGLADGLIDSLDELVAALLLGESSAS